MSPREKNEFKIDKMLPGFTYQDFVLMMSSKASKVDVEDMKMNKTNKTDSENQMKAIDIIHR
jgi:hypothetical protein